MSSFFLSATLGDGERGLFPFLKGVFSLKALVVESLKTLDVELFDPPRPT